MLMVVLGACGLACWVAAALLWPRRPRRSSSIADVEPRNPSREEDRFRPAASASGERIWLERNDVVWHEIVAWSGPSDVNARSGKDVRRSA
jgi:hypothetical protein